MHALHLQLAVRRLYVSTDVHLLCIVPRLHNSFIRVCLLLHSVTGSCLAALHQFQNSICVHSCWSLQGHVAHLTCSDLLSMSPLRILPPAACCFAPTSMVHTAFSMQSSLLRYEVTGSNSSCNQAGLLLLLLLLLCAIAHTAAVTSPAWLRHELLLVSKPVRKLGLQTSSCEVTCVCVSFCPHCQHQHTYTAQLSCFASLVM